MLELYQCKLGVHPKDLYNRGYSIKKSIYKAIEEWKDAVYSINRKLFVPI